MKVIQMIGSLLPSFKREEVADEVRALRECLEDYTIPLFDPLKKAPLKKKSKVVQDFEKEFSRKVRTKTRGDFIDVTVGVLENVRGLISYLENAVEKTFSRDIIVAGLTYRKAEVLRLITFTDFFVTYTRQNLVYLMAAEGNVDARTLPNGKERPIPEIKWLLDNRDAYFDTMNMLANNPTEIDKLIANIPDIVIGGESEEIVAQTQSRIQMDPLAGNLIAIAWNPFYSMGVRRANKRHARIQRAKNEKRSIEYRIEQLYRQQQNQPDAALEKTIEFYEGEVDRFASMIAKDEA